jgi:hypothetical protein
MKWTECLIGEFMAQTKKEEELNIPSLPFMCGLDNHVKKFKLQIEFIHNIVLVRTYSI